MKIFISHSSHDKWVARQMSRLLETAGHTTFLDEKDIRTGDSIDTSIQEHLKDCDNLVILLSPASVKSHWVFIELGGAKALGKRVVPILFHLGANEIPSAISLLLARDINDFDKYLEELREKAPATATAAQPAETPVRSTEAGGPEFVLEGTFGGLTVGDKVRITQVEHLTGEDKEQHPKWIPEMDKYSGLETHITAFWPKGLAVRLAADEGLHWWLPLWVSKVD